MQNRRELENIQWLLGHIYRDLKEVGSSTRGSRTNTKDSLFATQNLVERLITMTAELCNVVSRMNDQLEVNDD